MGFGVVKTLQFIQRLGVVVDAASVVKKLQWNTGAKLPIKGNVLRASLPSFTLPTSKNLFPLIVIMDPPKKTRCSHSKH